MLKMKDNLSIEQLLEELDVMMIVAWDRVKLLEKE